MVYEDPKFTFVELTDVELVTTSLVPDEGTYDDSNANGNYRC